MSYNTRDSRYATALALTALIGLLSACGKNTTVTSNTPANSGGASIAIGSSSSGTPSSAALPAVTESFTLQGNTGTFTSIPILTDTVLKVQVTAGAAQLNVGSNYIASYGCISYTVTVAGDAVTTQPLSVPGANFSLCQGNPSSQTIDFSGRLTPGHGALQVEVSNPAYDYYCELYYKGALGLFSAYNSALYCNTLKPVYQSLDGAYKHVVSGSLAISTNGSS